MLNRIDLTAPDALAQVLGALILPTLEPEGEGKAHTRIFAGLILGRERDQDLVRECYDATAALFLDAMERTGLSRRRAGMVCRFALGVLAFASAALPGELYEVAPCITRAGVGVQCAGALCANGERYEGLPKEVKSALTAGADAARDWYLDALEQAIEQSIITIAETVPQSQRQWTRCVGHGSRGWTIRPRNGQRASQMAMDAQGPHL